MVQAESYGKSEHVPPFGLLKIASCVLLSLFTVFATIFTEASKLKDGTYPYNTFMIPCAVEAFKLVASSAMFLRYRVTRSRESQNRMSITIRSFAPYAFPVKVHDTLRAINQIGSSGICVIARSSIAFVGFSL